MKRARIIPILLLEGQEKLVKTIQFKNPVYVGDPLNALKIFNEKEADEMIILDIQASKIKRPPFFDYIESLASECFMPVTYGGGIKSLDDIRKLLRIGVEKVSINTSVHLIKGFIKNAAAEFGSSTIVVSMDIKKSRLGQFKVYNAANAAISWSNPLDYAKYIEEQGAGELMVNFINKDGMQNGYEFEIIRDLCKQITIPIVACGGAGSLNDMYQILEIGASAAAAGSLFVFKGKNRAVLINYPEVK